MDETEMCFPKLLETFACEMLSQFCRNSVHQTRQSSIDLVFVTVIVHPSHRRSSSLSSLSLLQTNITTAP